MKRNRWTSRILGGLLALTPATGCKQQLFLEPADYQDALQTGPLARLETSPHDPIVPSSVVPGTAPATVLDPNRPARPMSLKEAIAISLEQGNTGFAPANNPGLAQDQFQQGIGPNGTDTIKAFAINPAVAASEVERSLARFDARFISSMVWQKQETATPVAFQNSLNNGDQAQFSMGLYKPLPTGGISAITFNTNYRNLSNPPGQNSAFAALPTSYAPQVQFSFEQPLLRNFGVEVNQLSQQIPSSVLFPFIQSGSTEGILITRIRLSEQQADFDRNVNNMLFNVETAYWNLFSAYYNLYAQEAGLKQSYDAYLLIQARAEGGLARPQSALLYKAQVELFRAQALTARGQVLTSERQLRGLLGMRSDDGTRLVPSDEPTLVPYRPDYYELANEALQSRPELLIARQELKVQQLGLISLKNLRRPDLRFFTQYDLNAIGTRLDGQAPQNALSNLALNEFNNWQIGLRFDMPIGFRDANAQVRAAQLNLRKAYFTLSDAERKTLEYLTEQYRQVLQAHELVKYRRAQREALEINVGKNLEVFIKGAIGAGEFEGFVSNLLSAQRDLANATASEFQAIAQYNTALAGIEYAKGTTQRYNNVTVSDGPLPPWVEKKAADHFRARDAALKLREHPAESGTGTGVAVPPIPPVPPQVPWQPTAEAPAAPPAWQAPAPKPLPMPTDPPGDGGAKPNVEAMRPVVIGESVSAPEPGFKPIGTVSLPPRRIPAPTASVPPTSSDPFAVPPAPMPVAEPVNRPLPPVQGTGLTAPPLSVPPYVNAR